MSPPSAAGQRGVTARTVRLEDPASLGAPGVLASLAGSDGFLVASPSLTLVGWGRALELALPRGLADAEARRDLDATLRAVAVDDGVVRRGTGAVALGALPFSREDPATLVVPEVLVGQDAVGCWVTVAAASGPGSPILAGGSEGEAARDAAERVASRVRRLTGDQQEPGRRDGHGSPEPARVLDAQPSPEGYRDAVGRAVAEIATGRLAKVVLGRYVDLSLTTAPRPADLLQRLRAREPSSTAFQFPTAGGQFVGASPELLVARSGPAVHCHPLAGTTGLDRATSGSPGGSPDERLLQSAKEREEHRLVVTAIAEVLAAHCDRLSVPEEPEVVRLASDARLGTLIEGRLVAEGGPVPTVLELVAALHPTPAVGGVPRAAALELISELEGASRELWAGPVGWTDGSGDGQWVLGIRSASLAGFSARVWAGAGVVGASDPSAELGETTLKLDPVVDALSELVPTGD